MIPAADLAKIPKAELHCHLEGALDLKMLWEFSQRHEAGRYASFDEFKAAATIPKGTAPGFKAFLGKFEAYRFHFGTLDDVRNLVWESVFNYSVNCLHTEFRFSPVFFARRQLKGDAARDPNVPHSLVEETATAIIETVSEAIDIIGRWDTGIFLTCDRTFGLGVNKSALDLLHRPIGQKISGLDLAGDESANASDFIKPFREWKDAGKLITIHAGEDPNAGGPRNIIEALDVFKADRIGHGVRAIEDEALVEYLAESKIPLEICPTSNVQTGAVSSAAAHPIKKLFDAGVCVTINTDDPTICGTTLEKEYAFAARLGMSKYNLTQCTRNSIRASLLSKVQKNQALGYCK